MANEYSNYRSAGQGATTPLYASLRPATAAGYRASAHGGDCARVTDYTSKTSAIIAAYAASNTNPR